MRHLLFASMLTVAFAAPAWADAQGDLKQGKEAFKKADFPTALTKLSSAIDSGGLKGDRLGEAYRTRAMTHFQLRDLRQAFADVSQALNANAKDAAALGLRCQVHVAGGNGPAAEADLNAARAINPKSGTAQVCEAGIYVRQRKFAEAVSAYDRAIEFGEDNPDLRANRAITLAMAGKPQDALAALDKVISTGRSASAAERAGWLSDRARLHAALKKPDAAVKDLDEAIKLDPSGRETVERYFLRARLNNDLGRFDKALDDLNRVIEQEQGAPDSRKALLFATRGSSHAAKGQFDRALADLDGAISLAKDVPPAVVGSWYVVRARANRAAGKPDAALQDYATALKQAPNDVDTLGERGEFLLRQGKADQALADFQAAVQKAPNNPGPYSWLGWGFAEKANYPKAIEAASKVVELRPQAAVGYWDRGVFRFLQGRFSESTGDLDQAVAADPRSANAVLLAHIARARAGDNRPELLAERAKSVDMSRWPGPLIRVFLKQASPEEALQAGNKIPNAETLFYVGQFYLLENQPKRAAELFRKAVDTKDRQYLEHTAARVELERLRS